MAVFQYQHPELGLVKIFIRSNATHFIAKWRIDHLALTVPRGARSPQIEEALNRMKDALLASKPETKRLSYAGVERMQFGNTSVSFCRSKLMSGNVALSFNKDLQEFVIQIHSDVDIDKPEILHRISMALKLIARKMFQNEILPVARDVAASLGVKPKGWKMSTGVRTLGKCDIHGVIHLSANLFFLPDNLRRYIICHELAHLTEFNHSPRFHQVCNDYCNGMEKTWKAELKHFSWPIIR